MRLALGVLLVILTLAPLLFLIRLMSQCAVDVPYWDQWALVPLLKNSYDGRLTFYDFWALHNEHRLVFPRLVMLILARLTRWNTLYEQGANVVFAALIFLVLARQAGRTARLAGIAGLNWSLPMISLLVFSTSQEQNWCWGWQMQIFMNVLAAVTGLALLAGSASSRARFAGAIALGVVAAYSFANGVVYWPAGLIVLLLIGPTGRRRVLNARVAWWIVAAVATTASYLYHFEHPPQHPPISFFLKHPGVWLRYAFTYLGSPCGLHIVPVAAVAGAACVAVFGWLIRQALRSRRLDIQALAPYVGFASYAIGSGMVAGIGRAGTTMVQALSSRYITTSNLLWISTLVLFYCLAGGREKTVQAGRRRRRREQRADWMKWSRLAFTAAALTLVMSGSLRELPQIRGLGRLMAAAREELAVGGNYTDYQYHYQAYHVLYPDPQVVFRYSVILRDYHLSVYR